MSIDAQKLVQNDDPVEVRHTIKEHVKRSDVGRIVLLKCVCDWLNYHPSRILHLGYLFSVLPWCQLQQEQCQQVLDSEEDCEDLRLSMLLCMQMQEWQVNIFGNSTFSPSGVPAIPVPEMQSPTSKLVPQQSASSTK